MTRMVMAAILVDLRVVIEHEVLLIGNLTKSFGNIIS